MKVTNLCVPSEEGAGEDHANNGLQEVCAPVVKGSPVPNGCSQNDFVLGFRIHDFGFRAFWSRSLPKCSCHRLCLCFVGSSIAHDGCFLHNWTESTTALREGVFELVARCEIDAFRWDRGAQRMI